MKSKEIEKLDDKIKNKWDKFKEINKKDIYNNKYSIDLIKLFEKYELGEKIEEHDYQNIITYTWVKYIFLNDLSLTNSQDLLNQINEIDSQQGMAMFNNKQPIHNNPDLDKVSYKIIYNHSLLFKLPNYKEHIKTNGMKYINDIILNYNNIYSSFRELYIKYFEDIEIQLKQISRSCSKSKINDIKKLINEDMFKITKEINTPEIRDVYVFPDIFFDIKEIVSLGKYDLEYLEEDGLIDFNIKYNELVMTTLNEILFHELNN
jgi:hypothetical protein